MSEDERVCPECGCDMEIQIRPPISEDLRMTRVRCPRHYVCLYCGHTEPV